jgi:hypothetical protein
MYNVLAIIFATEIYSKNEKGGWGTGYRAEERGT